MDGSPPRAAVVVNVSRGLGWAGDCTYLDPGRRGRRLGAAQSRTVWSFVEEYLTERYIDRAAVVRVRGE